MNLPNALTWLRIFVVPAIVVSVLSAVLVGGPGRVRDASPFAGITDSLDGYFARKLGLTSRLGAFLDPVADKLIVAVRAGADRRQGPPLVSW